MRPLAILATVLILALSGPVRAQDEGPAFRAVIQSQLDAFLADDVARAFAYASPAIQGIFRSPENFGSMVRNGYPMVWRPGAVQFLDLHPRDGGLWQRVRITDAQGAVHVLDYEMIRSPEGLRIGGVEVLQAPDVGA